MEMTEEKTRKRSFIKLGYSALETLEIVNAMNQLLADYSMHYQKLRNFHWNVKGADFFDVHEKFEDQYNDAKVAVDDIAERIRVFGQTPYSNMSDYLEHSNVKESPSDLTAMEMVKEIIQDYEILIESLYNTVDVSIEHGDGGTEDLAKGLVKKLEKNHWMMTAFVA